MILTVLLFWIYLFLLMLVFALQWLSLHCKILIIFLSQFPLTFRKFTTGCLISLHSYSCDYSYADWDDLRDHLRDVPWEDIFKLSASAASEFCEWVQAENDVYIPHHKYQVKAHSSSWFSASCAAVIIRRNHFFLFAPTE